jgi:hypothetical protein
VCLSSCCATAATPLQLPASSWVARLQLPSKLRCSASDCCRHAAESAYTAAARRQRHQSCPSLDGVLRPGQKPGSRPHDTAQPQRTLHHTNSSSGSQAAIIRQRTSPRPAARHTCDAIAPKPGSQTLCSPPRQ